MKINWIEVENFKGFDKRRFEFDEHFTLIVGENGTGKTTAVDMICQILGVCTQSNITDARSLIRIDTRILASGQVAAFRLPLRFACSFGLDGRVRELDINCTNEEEVHGLWDRLYGFVADILEELRADQLRFEKIYPICVCYPARRNFAEYGPDWSRIMTSKPFRREGYENWGNPSDSPGHLTSWMGRQEAISGEEGRPAPSYLAVTSAITSAFPGCSKVWFSAKAGQLMIEWENGERIGYSKLSDGQKTILTVVGDIARRAALLNPHLDNPAAETPGVVVIDEIDLHLHPRWQRRIMEDLRRTFPKVQFIATTHSPIIISAAKDAKVIQLLPDGLQEFPQAYGMDLNYIVEVLQGGEARPREVTERITRANELIEEGKLEEARGVVSEIKALQRGDAPDSIELESTIDNLIALAHAED